MQFHEKREANPELFTSRARNKAHYVQIGLAASFSHPCKNLGKFVSMVGDGEIIDTSSFEGMVVLNIPSFGGGADPWGSGGSKQKQAPSYGDGMASLTTLSHPSYRGSARGQ